MLRWQSSSYAMTTVDGIEEFTHLGTWCLADALSEDRPDYADEYGVEGPWIKGWSTEADPMDREIFVMVTRTGHTEAAIWQVRCRAMWLMNDDGDTIETIAKWENELP